MYSIAIDHDVKEANVEFIRDALVAHTQKVLGHTDFLEKQFSVLLKDENHNIRGGIIARFDTESAYIDSLWVDDSLRNQGYGAKLLKASENEACKLGCHYSTVDTYSFQAEGFYLKNGYERLGEIKNYYLHHSKIFLRKELKGLLP
jgi:ribosomal protein S18 acetylase RimI-like enzyme